MCETQALAIPYPWYLNIPILETIVPPSVHRAHSLLYMSILLAVRGGTINT